MKKLLFILYLIALLPLSSCEKEYSCDGTHTNRIGAICNDGSKSNAIGSGACSNHGGVKYWLCN
jgi:hypothetical protein